MFKKSLVIVAVLFLMFFLYSLLVFVVKVDKLDSLNKSLLSAEQLMINRYDSSTGKFAYEYNIKSDSFSDDDNFTRQMGAVYILGEMVEQNPNEKNIKALSEVVNSILDKSIEIDQNFRLIGSKNRSKIGATALFLAGAISLKDADKDWWEKNEFKLKQILDALLLAQKKSGDFASHVSDSITVKEKESQEGKGYYTGEALVALAKWHLNYPKDEKIKKAILKTYSFLRNEHSTKRYKGLYLWYMTATDKLVRSDRSAFDVKTKDVFAKEAIKHHNIEQNAVTFVSSKSNTCANTEGLGYFINFAKRYTTVLNEMSIFEQSLRNNLKLQITESPFAYGKNKIFIINKKAGMGAFLSNWSSGNTRIDYTQHCMGMILSYIRR